MFIDYITLMLISMVGGLVVLAFYVLLGVGKEENQGWGIALTVPGLVGLLTGLHMSLTWPIADLSKVKEGLPNLQFANIAFGEMSVLLGVLLLAGGVAIIKGWSVRPLTIYAFVVGAAAVVIGARLWGLGLTKEPMITGVGFIVTGGCGVLSGAFLRFRGQMWARVLGMLALLASAGIWAITAVGAYWAHLESFSKGG